MRGFATLVFAAMVFFSMPLLVFSARGGAEVPKVDGLQCEYWNAPLNVDVLRPRLSWVIRSTGRGVKQKAYQVLVASTPAKLNADAGDLWDSGKVESDQTMQVFYSGTPLHSGQACFWKVRSWDQDDQASGWSEPASWSMGLLNESDWKAKWIGAPGADSGESTSLGYHAEVSHRADEAKWVQVDLGRPVAIDSVTLHSMNHEVPGFGFPVRFSITASDDPEFKSADMIADHTKEDFANPGATSVSFDAKGIRSRYVRVTANRLFHRTAGDHSFCFALAELEVFSGGKNVALHAPVTALDSTEGYGWSKAELTDGLGLVPSFSDHGAADHTGTSIKTLPVFQKRLDINKPVTRAMLNVCGLGQYELWLNGNKLGNSVMDPGWTDYRKTCLYRSYDITADLKQGADVIEAMLGNGMYNVTQTAGRYTKFTGSMGQPKLILQLEITFADGSTQTVVTDNSWKVRGGPITFTSIYGGEDYDARLENAAESAWQPALETTGPGGKLTGVSQSAPPIIVAEKLTSPKPTHPRDGLWVYDIGQNCAQMPLLTVTGPAGATVRLTPGEVLNPDGTVSQESSGGPVYFSYTLRGGGPETWSPRFSYYGCRYYQVSGAVPAGLPNPARLPVINQLSGQFITSSSPIAGEFECSNKLFNRTAEITRWAMRNNLMSVVTDCPHREKLGWLEESHLVGPSLMYNMRIPALFTKVCADMADAQTPQGLVPDIAPEFAVFGGGFRDSPEWGSACILIPWQVYEWYGDTTVLERHYQTMQRYLAYLGSQAKGNILSNGLGDWYDLGPNAPGYAQLTPVALTATAFYYRDICIVQQTATLLGHDADAQALEKLGDQVRQSFNEAFYHPDKKTYASGSQAGNAIPLVFGLPPQADHQAIMDNIVADIRKRDNGLTAGDIGYRYLLRALADGGRSDVIFDMNSKSDKPGYGMIIAKGATSLTEAWDARPESSQDHFMLGHIMEWFYGDLAGIQPDPSGPGYKKILIKPAPVGNVTWAKASYESLRGTITSSWKIQGDTFVLDVTIPANCSATVQFPARFGDSIREGGKPVAEDAAIKTSNGNSKALIIQSGEYHFQSRSK